MSFKLVSFLHICLLMASVSVEVLRCCRSVLAGWHTRKPS